MKKKKAGIGQWTLTAIMGLFALFCLLPVILIVIVSFSSEESIVQNGFSFFPSAWSLDAWKYVTGYGRQMVVSYGVTIFITVFGTLLDLTVEGMLAYTLSRSNFRMRKVFSTMILITMLFSGGPVASYMVNTSFYRMQDTLWILILNGVGAMHVIIMRTYIQGTLSEALIESAKIDGASEYRTAFQVVMPCMIPALASVGFMKAIGYWNGWQKAYLYITDPNKTPLSLLLMKIEKNVEFLVQNENEISAEVYALVSKSIPGETARMAILLAALGPILVAYPFFQRYFVKGITIGSVKG